MSSIREKISSLSPEDRQLLRLKLADLELDLGSNGETRSSSQLTAYVVAEDWDVDQLRKRLSDHLPDYMIPKSFIQVPELPRLPNGKLDINSLKTFRLSNEDELTSEFKAPSTDLELKLAEIWKSILNLDTISIQDNFFEIGGDSIASIQVISRARDLGMPLKPAHLFEHQTIETLAQAIKQQESETTSWEFLTPLRKAGAEKPLFCIHSGGARGSGR